MKKQPWLEVLLMHLDTEVRRLPIHSKPTDTADEHTVRTLLKVLRQASIPAKDRRWVLSQLNDLLRRVETSSSPSGRQARAMIKDVMASLQLTLKHTKKKRTKKRRWFPWAMLSRRQQTA